MRKTIATLFVTALLASLGAAPATADPVLNLPAGDRAGGTQNGDGGFCWC